MVRLLVLAVVAVAACSPSAEVSNYDVTRASTQLKDPALRSNFIAHCQADWRSGPELVKQYLAAEMRVSVAAMPQTFCTRYANGIADGSLKAAEIDEPVVNGEIKPQVLAVLRG